MKHADQRFFSCAYGVFLLEFASLSAMKEELLSNLDTLPHDCFFLAQPGNMFLFFGGGTVYAFCVIRVLTLTIFRSMPPFLHLPLIFGIVVSRKPAFPTSHA